MRLTSALLCNVHQGAVLSDGGGMMPGSAVDDVVAARLWDVSDAAVASASLL